MAAAVVLAGAAEWLATRGGERSPAAPPRPGAPSGDARRAVAAAPAAPRPRDVLAQSGARGPAAATRALPGSVDLSAVMRQVHFAFRPRGDGYAGGHSTYAAFLDGGHLEVTPSQGTPVRFSPAVIVRGTGLVAAGAGVPRVGGEGQLEVTKGAVVEELQNGPDGVEQRWRFAERLPGTGDLEVRLPVVAGAFLGETDRGLHLSAGARGVRFGQGTWVDAVGTATPVPVRWDDGAVVLSIPAAVLDGSVYPAVLDPVIGPEVAVDEPVFVPAAGEQTAPALAWNGEHYLVAWEHAAGSTPAVWGVRVTSTGSVLDPGGIVIASAGYPAAPAVASDGTDFLVAWRSGLSSYDIKGARVRADGALLDATPLTISAAANQQFAPAVAWATTGYLAVWEDGRSGHDEIYGARIAPDGAVLDPAGVPVAVGTNGKGTPAIACDGATCLVAYMEFQSTMSWDVYAVRVSDAGVRLDAAPITVAARAGIQWYPAVAAGGGSFLVAWADESSGVSAVYGARVDAAGNVLDPAGIRITTSADAMRFPAVAWSDDHFLALWERTVGIYPQIWGARVGADGIVKDAAGFAVAATGASASQKGAAAACDGTSCLAVWADNGSGNYDVLGARVTGAGTVLDPTGIVISSGADEQLSPAVAWNDDPSAKAYLVVWQDLRSSQGPNQRYDVYGVRLSSDGVTLDAAGIAISTAQSAQSAPSVASGGAAGWLAVWDDKRSLAYTDIYGARVTGAGVVQEPSGIRITSRSLYELSPAVAFDGTRWLVVWYDGNGSAYDIYGARVSTAGAVLDPSPFLISGASNIQAFPSVACSSSECLVVWEDLRSGSYMDLYGARVSTAGTVLGSLALSTAAGNQFSPAIARGPSGYLVTWCGENGSAGRDVFAARVAGDGTILDPGGFTVVSAPSDQMSPAVGWDGASFLVAWTDYRFRDVYGARVSEAGTVLDPGGFQNRRERGRRGATRRRRLRATPFPRRVRTERSQATYRGDAGIRANRLRRRGADRGRPFGRGSRGRQRGAGAHGNRPRQRPAHLRDGDRALARRARRDAPQPHLLAGPRLRRHGRVHVSRERRRPRVRSRDRQDHP